MFVWWPKEKETESTTLHPVAVLIHDGGFLGDLGMFPDALLNESISMIEEYTDHGFVAITLGLPLAFPYFSFCFLKGSPKNGLNMF